MSIESMTPPCCQGTRLQSRNKMPSSVSPWAWRGPTRLAQLTTQGWAPRRSPLPQSLGFLSSETQLGVCRGGCEVLEPVPHPSSLWTLTLESSGQGHHHSSHYSSHCNQGQRASQTQAQSGRDWLRPWTPLQPHRPGPTPATLDPGASGFLPSLWRGLSRAPVQTKRGWEG